MSLHSFSSLVLVPLGLLALFVSSWNHDVFGITLGVLTLTSAAVITKLLHNKLLEEACDKVRLESLDARFKIADQAAEMIATLLRVTRPHLKVVKSSWGKSEDGRYSGTAVDVTDPTEGEWWITIESNGQAKTWIGAPANSTIRRLWKEDHNQKPEKWSEILTGILSSKRERI